MKRILVCSALLLLFFTPHINAQETPAQNPPAKDATTLSSTTQPAPVQDAATPQSPAEPASEAPSSTQPDTHTPFSPKTDLLAPPYTSNAYGIQFCPPKGCSEIDKASADTIVEFDRDDYNWQLKAWRVRLEQSLPLTYHNDESGHKQDGVLEITLAQIKQQSPSVQLLRNEIISVAGARVAMIAVRYETASHDRRLTQQAIFEAPGAENKLYYFFDLTGPGKPQAEPDDIINPAEKIAYDTFSEVVDSVRLLDRKNIVGDQHLRLYHTRSLFVEWSGDTYRRLRDAMAPQQFQRIIKDGQDVGYQSITESYQPDTKAPEESIVQVGIRSHLLPTPDRQWDTETIMFTSADGKHEHWHTDARCTNPKGELIDSFTQVATSDEQTRPVAVKAQPDESGSLLPPQSNTNQGSIDLVSVRTLECTATLEETPTRHRMSLAPFKLDVPKFYIPQAFSYILPTLLPLQPKNYLFAVFVPGNPQDSGNSTGGNVMSRYLDVLPLTHTTFHGRDFDAFVVNDKTGLEGYVTTYYISPEGRMLGSTATFPEGDKSTTIDILPTDAQTLQRIWNRPNLTPPVDQPAGTPPPTQ
jgi:hypothetical protein